MNWVFLIVVGVGIAAIILLQRKVDRDRRVVSPPAPGTAPEHAMIVTGHQPIGDTEAFYAMIDRIHAALDNHPAIVFDGHETAVSGEEFKLYFYAADGRGMFDGVAPLLRREPMMKDASVYIRFGDASDRDAPAVRADLMKEPAWP